jgi:hypothetical protein
MSEINLGDRVMQGEIASRVVGTEAPLAPTETIKKKDDLEQIRNLLRRLGNRLRGGRNRIQVSESKIGNNFKVVHRDTHAPVVEYPTLYPQKEGRESV